jgi:GrpB-like predicted nucleotidyltransferase (UPF0157 family)
MSPNLIERKGAVQDDLGLAEGMVSLAPHSQFWGQAFEQEAALLRAAFGQRLLGIQHIGSTAILGIHAKPILDILVGFSQLEDDASTASALAGRRYNFRPKAGIPAEQVFVKGSPRTHLLHVVVFNGPAWQQKLAFRDALREDPELARSYDALKTALSKQFTNNRAAYTAGKTNFVKQVLIARIGKTPFLSREAT